MNENYLLSIIVTSFSTDRIKDIYELLDSVKQQTYPNLEIIFVAERSVELYEKVGQYGNDKQLPGFKILYNDGDHGLSAARNLGIVNSNGDIIGFVDDDTLLFPDWAEQVVMGLSDKDVIGITGPAYPLWENESMSWFPEEFYWIVSCTSWMDSTEKKEIRNAWGMNMAFKKKTFDSVGMFQNDFGFHKGLVAEDVEFSLRARSVTEKTILYIPDAKVWHRVHKYRLSWRFIKERSHWIGFSRRNLKGFYPDMNFNTERFYDEYKLLKRICFKLFPGILKEFFRAPSNATRKLAVTVVVLLYLSLGYYSFIFANPFNRHKYVSKKQ